MARKKKQLKAVRAAEARKRRRNRKRKRAIILAVEIIVLLLLSGTAYVMAKFDKFDTVEINQDDLEINQGAVKEGYTTVALFGIDTRSGKAEETGTRTDTIILVSIDNKTKEVRMSSVYRDTILQQEDGTYNKVNAAYAIGGPKGAINVLNKNLDLDIEDYATVDFKAMSDAIDLLGGVELYVTEPEANMLNKYVKETAKAAGKKANLLSGEGTYTLDGPQAVTYARLRKLEGGDYKRTERQRTLIKALLAKAKQIDLFTVNEIIDTVFPQISTSFTLSEVVELASGLMSYELMGSEGFPFDKTDAVRYHNASVVIALGLAENVEDLHEFLYPNEEKTGVSETVQTISNEISYTTGVVRPAELDMEDTTEEEEQTDSSTPVITNADGSASQ